MANEAIKNRENGSSVFEGSFIDDKEKMWDFHHLNKEEFLMSYSYLTESEYDATLSEVRYSKLNRLVELARTELEDYEYSLDTAEKAKVNAYELVTKREIFDYIESELSADENTVDMLIQTGSPLSVLYSEWLKNDYDNRTEAIGMTIADVVKVEKERAEKDVIPNSVKETAKKALVVNIYGGPGIGKSTTALQLVAELKKQGINAEYVSEVAKELVYAKAFDKLDGSMESQKEILSKQRDRLDIIAGNVEVAVTDCSLMLNAVYLAEKNSEYTADVLSQYNEYNNFNFFLERDASIPFEQEGRIHTLEQSIEKDNEILSLLIDNNIEFERFNRNDISRMVGEIKDRLSEKSVDTLESNEKAELEQMELKDSTINWKEFDEVNYNALVDDVKNHNSYGTDYAFSFVDPKHKELQLELNIRELGEQWALDYDIYDCTAEDYTHLGGYYESEIPTYEEFIANVEAEAKKQLEEAPKQQFVFMVEQYGETAFFRNDEMTVERLKRECVSAEKPFLYCINNGSRISGITFAEISQSDNGLAVEVNVDNQEMRVYNNDIAESYSFDEIRKENRLDEAKGYIDDFLEKEYGTEPSDDTYKDMYNVPLGYTTLGEDNEYDFSVTADLIDFSVSYTLNDKVIKTETYDSLEDMTENVLSCLNFDDFVAVGNDAVEEFEAKEQQPQVLPLYSKSYDEAKENGETEQYFADLNESRKCAAAIQNAISDNYKGNRLDTQGVLSNVLKDYAFERAELVIAARISALKYDGRISRDNKTWADKIMSGFSEKECNKITECCYVNAHSGLIDMLAKALNTESDRIREQKQAEIAVDKDNYYEIYQIPRGEQYHDLRFLSYEQLEKFGQQIDPKNYEKVYSGKLDDIPSKNKLEGIFTMFNIDHPKDFKGRSLSVSDIVVLNDENGKSAHYVDSFGYKDVSESFLNDRKKEKTEADVAENSPVGNYSDEKGSENSCEALLSRLDEIKEWASSVTKAIDSLEKDIQEIKSR